METIRVTDRYTGHEKNLKICSRCIYDETVPSISFDENGVCNYCHMVDKLKEEYHTGKSLSRLKRMAKENRTIVW
jgi:hypothetical protein